MFNGKIHYFDWAMFNSELWVYQRVMGCTNEWERSISIVGESPSTISWLIHLVYPLVYFRQKMICMFVRRFFHVYVSELRKVFGDKSGWSLVIFNDLHLMRDTITGENHGLEMPKWTFDNDIYIYTLNDNNSMYLWFWCYTRMIIVILMFIIIFPW